MGFILQSDTPIEKVDWGSLKWMANPAKQSASHITALEVIISHSKGHDFHLHPNQEEIIYVLEGKIEQWIEKDVRILNKGDSVFIPKNTVHASFQTGESPAKLLVVLSPCIGSDVGYEIVEVHDREPWASLCK